MEDILGKESHKLTQGIMKVNNQPVEGKDLKNSLKLPVKFFDNIY